MPRTRPATRFADQADGQSAPKPADRCPHAGLDERFVPIRARELARALATDEGHFKGSTAGLVEVAEQFEQILDQECAAFEHDLADGYAWFNPDRDTLPIGCSLAGSSATAFRRMHDQVEYLLRKANFHKLTREQVEAAASEANSFDLRVRIRWEDVEELGVWVRGKAWTTKRFRQWRSVRGEDKATAVYRRMVVVSRLAGERDLRIMMFRDIPLSDVEALLPNADVQMGWVDRVQAFGGASGALGGLGVKITQTATTVVAWTQILWVITVGFTMLLVRALMGYRRARFRRDSQRTQHLFYQNMSNNAGALHLLASLVAQEELKEATLAWAFCRAAQTGAHPPLTGGRDLHNRIGGYIAHRWGLSVDFDTADALETLARLGLLSDPTRLEVVDRDSALERLRIHRRERASARYHFQQCAASGECLDAPVHGGGASPASGRERALTEASNEPAGEKASSLGAGSPEGSTPDRGG